MQTLSCKNICWQFVKKKIIIITLNWILEFSIHWTENAKEKQSRCYNRYSGSNSPCFATLILTIMQTVLYFLGFYDNDDVFVADTYTVVHVPEVEPCLNT